MILTAVQNAVPKNRKNRRYTVPYFRASVFSLGITTPDCTMRQNHSKTPCKIQLVG